jgi:hypothetical protein
VIGRSTHVRFVAGENGVWTGGGLEGGGKLCVGRAAERPGSPPTRSRRRGGLMSRPNELPELGRDLFGSSFVFDP